MINPDRNGRQTLQEGQYPSLEHVAVSTSPQMLAPSEVTVNTKGSSPKQLPNSLSIQ